MKGLVFESVLSTLVTVRSPAFRREVEAKLDGRLAEALRHNEILASGWYPTAWYRQMWSTIRDIEPSDSLVREVGRVSAENDLRTIHRLLLRLLSPATVMTVSQRVITRYFDRGGLETLERSPRRLRVRWVGMEGFDATMWIEMLSGAETILRLSGAEGVRLHVLRGGGDGDTEAEVVGSWS